MASPPRCRRSSRALPRAASATPPRALPLAILALLVAVAGCAAVPTSPSPAARDLLDQANAAVVLDDLEGAYGHLKQIRVRHPGSPESEKAFPLAAYTYRRLWFQHRFTQPDSVWLTSEKRFMFAWLASYFGDGDFPYQAANQLLVGFPLNFFRDFVEYGRSDPQLARWSLRAEADNGIIELVAAAPADEAPSMRAGAGAADLPAVSAAPPALRAGAARGGDATLIATDIAGGPGAGVGTGDMTWGPGLPLDVSTTGGPSSAPCPIVLDRPIFVKDGNTLTILPGCIVRGQPRSQPVQAGSAEGSPGALIVTRNGRIHAVGTRQAPIVFTTAAIDNDGDGVADDSDPADPFVDPWDPEASPPDAFLDDDPLGAPLAPLDRAGEGNVSLWGGMVILGRAPTNLSRRGVDWGQAMIEGLTIPGFPVEDATYGGLDPHHGSGRLAFLSIRHAGDELGAGNELNCLSLGGVGDATQISHVECYANFDDGFEWFGGTVHGDHLMATFVGDDAFDVDQGYTGVNQFLLALMPTFNEDDGDPFGSASGDYGAELDGDDRGNASTRADVDDGELDTSCWPLSNPRFYNLTVMGSTPDPGAATPRNPAVSPAPASGGLLLRNGFAGQILNALVVNTRGAPGLVVDSDLGDSGCRGSDTTLNVATGRVAIVSSTFHDVDPIRGYTRDAGTPESSDEAAALANGNRLAPSLGAPPMPAGANLVNYFGFAGLESEVTWFAPKGNARGKLDASLLDAPIDPQPRWGVKGVGNGVVPQGPGLDGAATYRGAFRRGEPKWTAGWTVLSAAGLLAD